MRLKFYFFRMSGQREVGMRFFLVSSKRGAVDTPLASGAREQRVCAET